jgi:hypothetical protein
MPAERQRNEKNEEEDSEFPYHEENCESEWEEKEHEGARQCPGQNEDEEDY